MIHTLSVAFTHHTFTVRATQLDLGMEDVNLILIMLAQTACSSSNKIRFKVYHQNKVTDHYFPICCEFIRISS